MSVTVEASGRDDPAARHPAAVSFIWMLFDLEADPLQALFQGKLPQGPQHGTASPSRMPHYCQLVTTARSLKLSGALPGRGKGRARFPPEARAALSVSLS